LCLFHDDRPPLQDAARELLDRRLGAFVGHGLDEGEATRPRRLSIESDANAANFDSFAGERLAKLLLGDVIREIADEKSSTHPSSWCGSVWWSLFCP